MTKRILSVVIVLCMMLTFVPFIGSAATVNNGYLMIDNTKAASGDGWSWENGVLTLSQSDEIVSIMLSVEADVVLAEDVTLSGVLILSRGGTVSTGEYTLTVLGGINGMNITVDSSTVVAYSIMSSEKLDIIGSDISVDCTDMSSAVGIYSNDLYIEQSKVTIDVGVSGDLSSNAIYAGEISFVNSVVIANSTGYGIATAEPDDDYTGKMEIANSAVYANGGISAVAAGVSYVGNTDENAFVLSDAVLTTPENGVVVIGTYSDGYNTAKFAGIADAEGNIVKNVVIEAADAEVLPDYEVPEIPENTVDPDESVDTEEPESGLEKGVYYEFIGTDLYLNVLTDNCYDRLALFYAEDTSLAACLMTTNDYSEYEDLGLRQWSFVLEAPKKTTDFVIKCRDTETQSYKNGTAYSFSIVPPYIEPVLDELYVGGVNAFETPEGEGWYFDEASRTLTLENCTLSQVNTYFDSDDAPINAIIFARGDLIINVVGDNSVEATITELPETYTAYGAIWVDSSYNNYEEDTLVITGGGNLTAGIAISQDTYKTGYVEFSFGVYVYSELGMNIMELDAGSVIDVYGGVVGVPATYNVRALQIAPTYLEGTIIESYKNIEGTMLDENGYDPINNEVWRFRATISTASVNEEGILTIFKENAAYGNGWSWENNVLTLGDIDFKAILFQLETSDVKIVLTQDVTLNAGVEEGGEVAAIYPCISFYTMTGSLEIETGDYTLTLLNNTGFGIDTYGTLIVNGNLVIETLYDSIAVSGELIIKDSVVYAEYNVITVYTAYDYETGEETGGNVSIIGSEVYVNAPYEDEYGYETEVDAIYAYCGMTIENSFVVASGSRTALVANNIAIKNSTVSTFGMVAGIQAFFSLDIDNSTVMADSANIAIDVANSFYLCEVVENAITLKGVSFVNPESAVTELVSYIDECENEYYTNTFVDADGNIAASVYMEAGNYADYDIINGKLIITVVTESRINRVALYDVDGNCIKTFNTYEIDENGNYVWTIKMDAPAQEIQYVIKGRDAEANNYKKGFTLPAITVEPEVVFESVEVETRGDKVYVIATTVSDNYDRVAIVNPVDGSYVKYTRNFEYDFENDTFVWTIFFDYAEGMDNLIVKARDVRNNRYNNAQAVEITVDAPVEPVIDVTITDYDGENILVTVTTVPDLYRVKIAYADDPTSYIAYARNPATMSDDAWTWEMVIARPAETTQYAVDVAYVKAYARYFTYVTYEA